MNILILTSSLQRFPNDSQIPFVLEQALAWKKCQPQDQIHILAPHDSLAQKEENLSGLKVRRFVYWWPKRWQKLAYPAILPNISRNPFLVFQIPTFLLSEFFVTLQLVKKNKINLIFAHWVMPQGVIAFLVHKITKIPYGLKNYSSDLRIFNKIPLIGKPLARHILKNARILFCENSILRQEAIDFFPEKECSVIQHKIKALSMGVTDLSLNEKYLLQKYDLGFIGRLSKKKGIHYFFKALQQLKKEGIEPRVAIAGEGEEKQGLLNSSQNLNIQFIGFVAKEKKAEFFNETGCLVFPSVEVKGDIEGLPVALLEAIYFGKTVIASRDTNIELLPEWDQIKEVIYLLNDPSDVTEFTSLLKKVGSLNADEVRKRTVKIKSIFKRYNWDNLIHEYIQPLQGNHV